MYMYAEERHTWSQYHAFTEKDGITVGSPYGEESYHFKDARGFLKYLRNKYPSQVFKSKRFNYYGVFWVIYIRD